VVRQNDFYEVMPPILSSNACEGGSTLFEVSYFGEKAFLSQSAQMYLEAIMFSLENVYALTPSFRAEKSRTTRHLAEYCTSRARRRSSATTRTCASRRSWSATWSFRRPKGTGRA